MRILTLFQKGEQARYLAQLDVLRAMQRAIRRANLPVKYSEGFNPHMLISFATASGVGVACEEEILDARMCSDMAAAEFLSRLNSALPPGFTALKSRRVEDWFPQLMPHLKRADYSARFLEPLPQEAAERVRALLEAAELKVEVQGKRGLKLCDIRPLIYDIRIYENEMLLSLAAGQNGSAKPHSVIGLITEQTCTLNRLGLFADDGGALPLFAFEV